jgi:hypothetical protein
MQWRSIYQLFYLLWFSQECEARAFVSPSPVSATRVQDDQEPNKLVPNCMATWVSVLCHFRKKLCLQMMRKVSSRLILAARISELLEFSWGWISPTAQGQQFLIIPEQRERERERCSKLEIELTLPKQLIPRCSSRDTTTNTVATVATAHAGVCSSDFCCSAIFWSTGPKTNSLHLHTHLQLNPKIFYGKKKRKKEIKFSKSRSSSSSTTWIVQNLCICSFRN